MATFSEVDLTLSSCLSASCVTSATPAFMSAITILARIDNIDIGDAKLCPEQFEEIYGMHVGTYCRQFAAENADDEPIGCPFHWEVTSVFARSAKVMVFAGTETCASEANRTTGARACRRPDISLLMSSASILVATLRE